MGLARREPDPEALLTSVLGAAAIPFTLGDLLLDPDAGGGGGGAGPLGVRCVAVAVVDVGVVPLGTGVVGAVELMATVGVPAGPGVGGIGEGVPGVLVTGLLIFPGYESGRFTPPLREDYDG